MHRILVVHGPNLNLLGTRQPEIYGRVGLAEINAALEKAAGERGAEIRTFQSNHEGAIIDALHEARGWANAVIINAGAYTHYSHAIADALAARRGGRWDLWRSRRSICPQWKCISRISMPVKSGGTIPSWRQSSSGRSAVLAGGVTCSRCKAFWNCSMRVRDRANSGNPTNRRLAPRALARRSFSGGGWTRTGPREREARERDLTFDLCLFAL